MKTNWTFILIPMVVSASALSQPSQDYWQQEVAYTMNIDFDDRKHQFSGEQTLVYTNNSPDTLEQVFYHLFFNAFQPGSMMDVRSRTIKDPDSRIGSRIEALSPEEIGYQKVLSLKQDGQPLKFEIVGTVAEVQLNKPLMPGEKSVFTMIFKGQVPVQIRRSGRNSKEGVDYTMTQWYPKMAEYDQEGWHADPYIGREFHGVFGSFEVNITIDSKFTLAGTGVVSNPEEVGKGYARTNPESERVTWRFEADNVHDFAWAADAEYRHLSHTLENGTVLHFFHLPDSIQNANWDKLVSYTQGLFEIMNARFGEYPYPQFSVIQGGDGGMEYPMCTMITSGGTFGGLVSVTVHEAIHNWYYGMLATNESKYPWMDEGFTTYAQNIVLDSLFSRNKPNPHLRSYDSYLRNASSGNAEPLSTHADFYKTNENYGVNAYSKGCVFLAQLRMIVGESAFDQAMLKYFNQWQFKHPTPQDFKRIVEKTSNLELDWYFDAWIGTTKTIDYGIQLISQNGKNTRITLERLGEMPMPIEVTVYSDKKETVYYVPLQIMRGAKTPTSKDKSSWIQLPDWPWTYPYYKFEIDVPMEKIDRIEIDPMYWIADTDRSNNVYPQTTVTFPASIER